jgi:hypothetical protein
LFVAASWLPLLLDLLLTADTPRRRAALALAGGCFCLAGHFQTVLYGFSAAALVTLWRWRRERRAAVWLPLAVLVGGGLALSAVQVLPSAELVAHSLRLRLSSAQIAAGAAEWRSLLTLAWPNAVGTFDQPYPGPRDISQHYFYSGLLLLPLSAWGLRDRRVRSLALVLIVPAGLYALGPQGPVFWLAGRLPGFAHVRAPSHAMGMVLLGLALLAGAGAAALFQNHRRLSWILLLGAFGDLFYWNMWRTPLVYDRAPWEQTYGAAERWFREQVGPQQPLERFASPGRWEHIYPSQAPFGLGIESAAGDNPLVLARYHADVRPGGQPVFRPARVGGAEPRARAAALSLSADGACGGDAGRIAAEARLARPGAGGRGGRAFRHPAEPTGCYGASPRRRFRGVRTADRDPYPRGPADCDSVLSRLARRNRWD